MLSEYFSRVNRPKNGKPPAPQRTGLLHKHSRLINGKWRLGAARPGRKGNGLHRNRRSGSPGGGKCLNTRSFSQSHPRADLKIYPFNHGVWFIGFVSAFRQFQHILPGSVLDLLRLRVHLNEDMFVPGVFVASDQRAQKGQSSTNHNVLSPT